MKGLFIRDGIAEDRAEIDCRDAAARVNPGTRSRGATGTLQCTVAGQRRGEKKAVEQRNEAVRVHARTAPHLTRS